MGNVFASPLLMSLLFVSENRGEGSIAEHTSSGGLKGSIAFFSLFLLSERVSLRISWAETQGFTLVNTLRVL